MQPPLLRAALVGLGFSQAVHLPAFRRIPGIEVAALVGRDAERTRAAARAAGIPSWDTDLERVLERDGIGLVAIAVPPQSQPGLACTALRSGAHVYCEKPLADTVAGARAIVEAASASGRRGAVGFIFPELTPWRRLGTLLATRELGKALRASVSWKTESWTVREGGKSWKLDPSRGGGALGNFASHVIHYLRTWFGEIEEVHALPTRNPGTRFLGLARFASGVEADVSIDCGAFMGQVHRVEIYCEGGTAVLENTTRDYAAGFSLRIARRDQPEWERLARAEETGHDGRIDAVASILKRLHHNLSSGEKIMPDLGDGLKVQQAIQAFRELEGSL